jgi:hypothetical protein
MVNSIGAAIEKHEGVGSGFKVHDTEYISLEIAFMKASEYGAKVDLPAIIPPSAVLDLTDVPENECFKHAFLASKHYEGRIKWNKDGTAKPNTSIKAYQGFEHLYKFPVKYPINKEEALRFCRKYNTRLCIFTYLEEEEELATTCYVEPKNIEDVNKQSEMVSTYLYYCILLKLLTLFSIINLVIIVIISAVVINISYIYYPTCNVFSNNFD